MAAVATVNTQRADVERSDLSRKLAAQAQRAVPDRLDLALLLGVAASDTTRGETTSEAKSSLLTTLTASPHLRRFLQLDANQLTHVAVSPDGATAAVVECEASDSFGCSVRRRPSPRSDDRFPDRRLHDRDAGRRQGDHV